MSFDVNVLSAKPVIKAAASMQNDGGGGNLGYMAQGGSEEEKKQQQNQDSIFVKRPEYDTFGFEKDIKMPYEPFSFAKLVAEIILSIKNLFIKK